MLISLIAFWQWEINISLLSSPGHWLKISEGLVVLFLLQLQKRTIFSRLKMSDQDLYHFCSAKVKQGLKVHVYLQLYKG